MAQASVQKIRTCETPLPLARLISRAIGQDSIPKNDVVIRGVTDDSREVGPGWLFVAVAGHEADGHLFIGDAISKGAAAVVAQHPVEVPQGVQLIQASDTRVAAARLAAVYYGVDDLMSEGGFRLVAVTGTNGKSTFCYLTRAVAQAGGRPCALVGTIEYDLLSRKTAAANTTPGPVVLARLISEAASAGGKMLVMEASSHALDQHRTDGVEYDVAVFTNLTGDHLDYHGTMENYLLAKKRLFDGLSARATAVLNRDDPAWVRMGADTHATRLTYGLDASADVRARILQMTAGGTRYELITPAGTTEIGIHLVGQHNVMNNLAAAAAVLAMGTDLKTIRAGLESVQTVAGRLERVRREGAENAPTILVDYAHTDDAMQNVLSALRPLTRGQLTVVFGCGGDRDRTKRPRMARVAAEYADRIVVTSDNPRTEKPESIIEEILTGFDRSAMDRVIVEVDRRKAIVRAIEAAGSDDVVLIAGKGHEDYQILGKQRFPFDDRIVAGDCLDRRCVSS